MNISYPLKILRFGNPLLRNYARPFTKEEITSNQTKKLVYYMKKFLAENKGYGISAPQVGLNKQLIVINIEETIPDIEPVSMLALFNPTFEYILTHEKIWMLETSHSLPDFVAKVPRYNNVIVRCLDEDGNPKKIGATGYNAGVIQSISDHLDGKIFIDRLKSTKDLGYRKEFEKYMMNDPDFNWKGTFNMYDG